ncbi:MAG: precorrin-6Y C5,15-methyltransferase (decarboxylating) subunit CbiT, partial [Synergistaceae bacterium]
CETWNETVILSGHGREIKNSEILNTADKNRSTAFFCGGGKTPSWLAALLAENGLDGTELIIGENLSYENQRITRGHPSELAQGSYDSLSLVLIINENPCETRTARLRDSEFIRGEVPMTREEVRSVIIDKLELKRDSVVWDIGAGTGSVTAAAALEAPCGEVFAVECEKSAADLVRANANKFRLFNVSVHDGKALEVIGSLPRPTHVFIGGSGCELEELLHKIFALGSGIRVVVSCVTLKTYTKAFTLLNENNCTDFDAVQINVSRAKKLGASTIMAAQNPVTIMSALTESGKKEVL